MNDNPLDVFIDLENIGISWGITTSIRKIEIISERLAPSLGALGFSLHSVSCFACDYSATNNRHPKIKGALRPIIEKVGWNMFWSKQIADYELIAHVVQRCARGTLSPAVLLVSNDGHFHPVINAVKKKGHKALVAGTQLSKSLRLVADQTYNLWELLGENPHEWRPYMPSSRGNELEQLSCLLNFPPMDDLKPE